MRLHRLAVPTLVALVSGCADQGPPPPSAVSTATPESSEVTFQAVDAGTGAALTDPRMTVRYLVRSPITVDAAGTESVPSAEAFRVAESVGQDSLVVEVRLEAPSYHRVDTVLAVARGASAGPFTLRMARRLDGAAAVATRPVTAPAASANDGIDRSALLEGDRAFQAGDWVQASMAYERLVEPAGRTSAYAREYQAARVRRGAG